MSEQIDPVRTLKAARQKLVQERRGLAVAIALGYRRRRTDDPQTNEMRETFVFLQGAVEAIERAIVHEELIRDEPMETFTLPSPQAAPAQPLPTVEGAPATVPT